MSNIFSSANSCPALPRRAFFMYIFFVDAFFRFCISSHGQFFVLTIIWPFILFVYIDFRPYSVSSYVFSSIPFFAYHILRPTISSYMHFFVYAFFRRAVFCSTSFSSHIFFVSLFFRACSFSSIHFPYSFSYTHFSVSMFYRSIIRFEARLIAQISAQWGSAQPGVRFDLARGSAIRSEHIARSLAPGNVHGSKTLATPMPDWLSSVPDLAPGSARL